LLHVPVTSNHHQACISQQEDVYGIFILLYLGVTFLVRHCWLKC